MLHLFHLKRGLRSMRRVEEYWFKFEYPAVLSQEETDGEAELSEQKQRLWGILYDAVATLESAVVILVLLFSLVIRPAAVIGDSMLPSFSGGDRVACVHSFSGYKRGDVIIISHATRKDESIIKRVIAVGGDTVDIDFYNGTVSVNGQVLDESYTRTPTNLSYDMTFPVTVPEGTLFVLGDNRNDSIDSRSTDIGFVAEEKVLGKVVLRFYPFNKIEIIKN